MTDFYERHQEDAKVIVLFAILGAMTSCVVVVGFVYWLCRHLRWVP